MMQPSPETDLRVTDACGFAYSVDENGCPQIGISRNLTFSPSDNLNDAFLAAEKAGLFLRGREGECLMRDGESWQVWKVDKHWEFLERIATQATAALAICAAILALKEKEHDASTSKKADAHSANEP